MRTVTGMLIGMSSVGTMKASSAVSSPDRFEREDRCRAEQVVGIAFVVGVDRDQADLRVGRALVEREVRRMALGDRVGIAEDALGRLEGDVPRDLGFAGMPSVKEVERSGWPPAWGEVMITWLAKSCGPDAFAVDGDEEVPA